MKNIMIDMGIPMLVGMLIAEIALQFTNDVVMVLATAWPVAFLYGFFVHRHVAKFLRG